MSPSRRSRRPFHDRLLSFSMRGLKKLGVQIEIYFTVFEAYRGLTIEQTNPSLQSGFLDREDAEKIAEIKHGGSLRKTREWFDEGKLCFGVRDDSRLVGKMWCDLEAFHFPPEYRALDSDEAYFFAAAVSEDYKGQNIAPLLRIGISDALKKMGRNRFYSYTEYFNRPARRFKEKLGCSNHALRLHVNLFGKWKRTWTLKQYAQTASKAL